MGRVRSAFFPRLVASLTGVTTLVLTSCSTPKPQSSMQIESREGEPLQIVTTFLPMTSFTQAVAGDRATVTQLLPPSVDPHDYQAKPQDAQRLSSADVLVKNGLSFESFLTDLITNAGNAELTVVDASEGIEEEAALAVDHSEDEHSEHAHSENKHSEDEHSEDEHSEDEHSEHDHSGQDPHVWLDPKKAVQQVENIRDALITADPDGKAVYTANAADYISELQALDREISEALAPYADQTFVTYHDFAGHFAHSYDLEVEYLVNVPESSAAPADVRRVIDAAQASSLKTLLSEPQQTGSPFAAAAKDLGIEVSTFDPLETSDRQVDAPDYYLDVMTANMNNLKAAFGE